MRGWRTECSRFFFSWRFGAAVCGVLVIFFVSIFTEPNFPENMKWETVYTYFTDIFYGMPVRISLLICSIPYGLSLCDDMEYRYIYAISSRQSAGRFLLRRMTAIFFSSWLVMVISLLLFVLIMRNWVPWCDVTDTNYILCVTECGGFYDMLMKREALLFFMVYSMEFALLPGTLSVLAAGISIWIPDRLLTLSIPFLVVYMTLDLSVAKGMRALNIWQYYDILGYSVDDDFIVFCQGIALSMGIFLITYLISVHALKRRLANG